MTYNITIKGTISKTIKVEASSKDKAMNKVWADLTSDKLIFNSDDFVGCIKAFVKRVRRLP